MSLLLSPNFLTFKEPKNRFQGPNSARLCGLAGRYDNLIPTLFLAPIDYLKILALVYLISCMTLSFCSTNLVNINTQKIDKKYARFSIKVGCGGLSFRV